MTIHNLKNSKKTGNEGFTLLELLLVVSIIATLSAVAIPMLAGVQKKASASSDAFNMSGITKTIANFTVINGGNYPDTFDSLLGVGIDSPWLEENAAVPSVDDNPTGLFKDLDFVLQGNGNIPPAIVGWNMALTDHPGQPGPADIAVNGFARLNIHSVIDHRLDADMPNNSAVHVNARGLRHDPGTPNTRADDFFTSIVILNTIDADADGRIDVRYVQAIYEHYDLVTPQAPDIAGRLDTNRDGFTDSWAPMTNANWRSGDYVAVFGVGRKNSMIGNINGGLQDSPFSTSVDMNKNYSRYLLLFLMPKNMETSAKFLGVISPRAELKEAILRDCLTIPSA